MRFTARLSSARPWTVPVTDAAGAPVASGTGDGRERRLDVGRHVRRADRVHVLDRGRSGRAAGDRNDRPGRDVADDDRRAGEARDVHAERRQPGRLDGDQLHAEPRVHGDRDASGRVGGDARNAVRRAEEGRPAVVQVHGDRCRGRSVLGRAEREGAERTRGERGRADRRRQDARGVRGLAGGLLAERGRRLDQLRFTFVLGSAGARQADREQGARVRRGSRSRAAGAPLGRPPARREARSRARGHRALRHSRADRALRRRHEEAGLPAALEGAAALHRERAGDRDRHGRRRAGSRRRRAGPFLALRWPRDRSPSPRGTRPATARRSVSGSRSPTRRARARGGRAARPGAPHAGCGVPSRAGARSPDAPRAPAAVPPSGAR